MRRRSARFRLTALYCCLFLPSAMALCILTYILIVVVQLPTDVGHLTTPAGKRPGHGGTTVTIPGHIVLDPAEFLLGACIVLVAMIGISLLLGWLVAGRVLRPLRVMTSTTRQISERNLHERLALTGPDDELKDLGDTIDGLLARLEAAFDSQQRFVANASHELRTPLMLSQTLLQVALANPHITLDSLRAACYEVIDAGKDQAQLIDALLTLARSQRGLDHREPVNLTSAVKRALSTHEPLAVAAGVHVDAVLDHAGVSGDGDLISRLVSNLVDNAIRYNIPGGRVEVGLSGTAGATTLTVANTGPSVSPDQVRRLLEPFQRAADRMASPAGLGLGLSIVADIAEAHHARLQVRARPEGGLTVAVCFPPDRPVSNPKLGGATKLAPA